MRYQNVKALTEINLPGVTIDLDQVGESTKAITFSVNGRVICRAMMDAYNLYLQRPADPKTKEVYRLSGNVLGIPICKDFETKWSAEEEASRLRCGIVGDSDITLAIDKVIATVEE